MTRLPLLALTCGLVVVGAVPALADGPQRTAWYTAFSAGGLVVPAPGPAPGDLRVGGTGDAPTAYATLLLASPGTAGGTLTLAVRSGAAGTPTLAACPTKTTAWKAGGGQPFDAGPGYDCSNGFAVGTLSSDGTSVEFPVDDTVQTTAGTLSVAVVPLPGGTAPFQVDVGDAAYAPAAPPAAPAAPAAAPPSAPSPQPVAAAGPALAPAAAPQAPAAAAAPEATAPLLAGALPAEPAPSVDAPALALPETPAAAPVSVLPTARLAAEQQQDDRSGPRLLALATLVVVSAGAGYVAGQQRPAPRLLGGRAAAGVSTALVVPEPEPDALPRGIGRFSRVRDDAPRRLR